MCSPGSRVPSGPGRRPIKEFHQHRSGRQRAGSPAGGEPTVGQFTQPSAARQPHGRPAQRFQLAPQYETYSKLLDESKREHALAVITPSGAVVLHLGGMDTNEHKEMLPAYELAKQSLRVNSQ